MSSNSHTHSSLNQPSTHFLYLVLFLPFKMSEYALIDINTEPFVVILSGFILLRLFGLMFASINSIIGLRLKIESLRRQKRGLDTVKDFVKISKIDRSIIVLEKQIEEAQVQEKTRKERLGWLEFFFSLLMSVMYWRIGVLRLPSFMIWPFSTVLSLPFAPHGWVSATSFSFLLKTLFTYLSGFKFVTSS